jgi:hypothetical protein
MARISEDEKHMATLRRCSGDELSVREREAIDDFEFPIAFVGVDVAAGPPGRVRGAETKAAVREKVGGA